MIKWEAYPKHTGYEVSDTGLVRNAVSNRIRKPRFCNKGYLRINLRIDGKHTTCLIHQMVADTFLPYEEGKDHINHIDNDPSNNSVSNLERCTHQENMSHSCSQGRKGKGPCYTPEQIYAVKYTYAHLSSYKTAEITGVKAGTILRVRRGEQWTHI